MRQTGHLIGAAVVLSLCVVAGCASPMSPDQSVPVTALSQPEDSTLPGEATFVVRDAGTLRTVWAQIFAGRTAPAVPSIDFSTQMLVIVAMGRQPSSGYGVQISSATRGRDGIVVHVTMSRPGDNCGTATVMTGPIAIARLPKSDATVRFDVTRVTTPCR